MGIKNNALHFICFISIFLVNCITDLIYYLFFTSESEWKYVYCKIIECFTFVSFEILMITLICLKKFLDKISEFHDYFQIIFHLILLIFYCEYEYSGFMKTSPNKHWDFAFIIGIFIIYIANCPKYQFSCDLFNC